MADLEVTFLGSGTSQGVPMIGCPCEVCTSADPRDKRTRSSIHVRTPEAALVVDTGPEFRIQCLREGIAHLDAVVYTHSHTDHIMGFDDLRRFSDASADGKMHIYASPETMADIQRVFRFAFDGTARYPGYIHPEPHIVEQPFLVGETLLTPLPVPHGRIMVNGYLFSRGERRMLAYLSDCKAVPGAVRAQIDGVEMLVIDALRRHPHPTHLSLSEAIAAAETVHAQRTWLTHLCHDLGHAATEKTLPPSIRIAYDGLRVSL